MKRMNRLMGLASASGFGHPSCDAVGNPSSSIISNLPNDFPIGS